MNHTVVVRSDPPNGVTTAVAAEELDVTIASICRWVETGYLPVVQLGHVGKQPHLFDLNVVRKLASRRAEAKRALDWKAGALV